MKLFGETQWGDPFAFGWRDDLELARACNDAYREATPPQREVVLRLVDRLVGDQSYCVRIVAVAFGLVEVDFEVFPDDVTGQEEVTHWRNALVALVGEGDELARSLQQTHQHLYAAGQLWTASVAFAGAQAIKETLAGLRSYGLIPPEEGGSR